jgi:hypothetical protein
VTATWGELAMGAGEHTAAAVSYGELPDDARRAVARQLDRLVATLARYTGDLPPPNELDPGLRPQPDGKRLAELALCRAAHSLREVASDSKQASPDNSHPAVRHLSAAVDHIAAGRDLLQTHFAEGLAGTRAPNSWRAPLITSGPVTAALLGELAAYPQNLAPWIARLSRTPRGSPDPPTSAQLALHNAEPWLRLAGAALRAAQHERHPHPPAGLLHAIPANTPPPRPAASPSEPVPALCDGITITAERLRHAALAQSARAPWPPAATSASWPRAALGSAIVSHCSEIILRTLAERTRQLAMDPVLDCQLRAAADGMQQACASWRAVTRHWDIVTTGTHRGAGTTPVAAEITDLVAQAGRLTYRNPRWTPARADSSATRDPASLAQAPGHITAVLAAVHQAADATMWIAVSDHQSVAAAAAADCLYIPVRLLSDKYDIPHPYTALPRWHADALQSAYDSVVAASTQVTAALDNLAAAVNAPSSVLAAARQAPALSLPGPCPQHNEPHGPQPPPGLAPGATEQTLRQLRISNQAMLLRAAAIDEAAREMIAKAMTITRSRDIVTRPAARPVPGIRNAAGPAARTAGQDVPLTPQPAHPGNRQPSLTTPVPHHRGAPDSGKLSVPRAKSRRARSRS